MKNDRLTAEFRFNREKPITGLGIAILKQASGTGYRPSLNLVTKNSGNFALRMRACVAGMS